MIMFRALAAVSLAATLAVTAGGTPILSQDVQGPALTIEPLGSPTSVRAMAPQITNSEGRLILSWLEPGTKTALKFVERTAGGWSAVRTVISGPSLIANAADVPSVRAFPDGRLVAHWTEENGDDPEASTLRLSVTRDGGRTWSTPVTPYRDASATQHGFASVFSAPGGGYGVIWLDGRDESSMALRAALYGADNRPLGETVVDDRACECCPMGTAVTADGPLVVFRNRTAAEVRDIFVSRFAGGRWTAAAPVHNDGWTIDACPVNGPAVAAAGRSVAVAWFTGAGGKGRTFAAFSNDAGRTFGAPVRIDDQESLGHVSVDWLDDRTAVVGWIEFTNGRSLFRARRIAAGGKPGPAVTIAESGRTQYPRLAHGDGELLFAWTENTRGTTALRLARAAAAKAP